MRGNRTSISARRIMPLAVLLLPLAACDGGDAAAEADEADPVDTQSAAPPAPTASVEPPADVITDLRQITFSPELEVNLDDMEERDSGLFVQVLESGSGPPAGFGDEMAIHYTLWLPNGSQVDSSHDRGEPLPMVLGTTPLVDGWVEGVTGMRLGEKRRLVLPYHLAYGAQGSPPRIPGYTPLVFIVELAEHVPTGEG